MKLNLKRHVLFFAVALGSLQAQELPANWPTSYPEWWYTRGVIDISKPFNQQNDAILNHGQLWNLAAQGIAELDEKLAPIGGAGFDLNAFEVAGATPDYGAPANLGQLKHVSSKFYDRFAQIGFDSTAPSGWPFLMGLDAGTGYPWALNQTPENLSPANLGQAKHLFSWDLSLHVTVDSEGEGAGDGIPDWWELFWFDSLDRLPDSDEDLDGLLLADEFSHHTSPTSKDTDQDGLEDLADSISPQSPVKRDHPDLKLEVY